MYAHVAKTMGLSSYRIADLCLCFCTGKTVYSQDVAPLPIYYFDISVVFYVKCPKCLIVIAAVNNSDDSKV